MGAVELEEGGYTKELVDEEGGIASRSCDRNGIVSVASAVLPLWGCAFSSIGSNLGMSLRFSLSGSS